MSLREHGSSKGVSQFVMPLLLSMYPFLWPRWDSNPRIRHLQVLSLTTKVRGLDRVSYPSFPAPRLADRIGSISS